MDTLSNGDLLTVAEEAGFDLLLTTDKNIRNQRNLEGRRIARNPSVRPGHSAGEPIATGSRMLAHSHLIGGSMGGARTPLVRAVTGNRANTEIVHTSVNAHARVRNAT